jgi:hypothetical protein
MAKKEAVVREVISQSQGSRKSMKQQEVRKSMKNRCNSRKTKRN